MRYIRKFSKVLFIVALVFIYWKCFSTAIVHGVSMLPTLEEGDYLFLRRFGQPKVGDIVAIYDSVDGQVLCKRIIGTDGDRVEIVNGSVYNNGILLDEPYVLSKGLSNDSCIVPKGYVYVLGDNRAVSKDSRSLGCLPTDLLHGTVVFNITGTTSLSRSDILTILVLFWVIVLLGSCVIDLFTRRRKV